jgi:hypothetical protein
MHGMKMGHVLSYRLGLSRQDEFAICQAKLSSRLKVIQEPRMSPLLMDSYRAPFTPFDKLGTGFDTSG